MSKKRIRYDFIRWGWAVLAVALCLMGTLCTARAEVDEERLVEAQCQWKALVNRYGTDLSDQERYALHCIFDGIGMATNTEVIDVLDGVNGADAFKEIINGGFFDASHYPIEDSSAFERVADTARNVLRAANLEIPPCMFLQHFDIGMYRREEGWYCELGHMEESEPVCDYLLYFSGDDIEMMSFEKFWP